MVHHMEFDSGGLEILGHQECMTLLRSTPLGRIAFTQHALPAIQPVNYALDTHNNIIIRTVPGSKLSAATTNTVVAFETDHYDPIEHHGWSVMIIGQARAITDPHEITTLTTLTLHPWAPGHRTHYLRIHPEIITGRRISPAQAIVKARADAHALKTHSAR
jgi:nitroimidazol reductase NimA-like FMN-containing flavoprotein (pyridoxamine 5'-phosphate oxidase superfamily)